MSATLSLHPAKRGEDGVPVADGDSAIPTVTRVVALRHDMTVAWWKQEVADACFPETPESKEPFECDFPIFRQYVKLNHTYDHYLVAPKQGWKKTPTLDFFTEIRKGSETRLVVGSYVVDLTRDAEGVPVLADKRSAVARLLSRAKLPRFGFPFRRCRKGASARASSSSTTTAITKTEPLLVVESVSAIVAK